MMRLFALVLGSLLLAGCGPTSFDDPDRFREYVQRSDGPFVQTVEHDHVTVTARYAPPEAMALSSVERALEERTSVLQNASLSDSSRNARLTQIRKRVDERKDAYDRSLYFYLTITPTDGDLVYQTLHQRGYGAYQAWLERLLFGLQKKIMLQTDGGDEVPLSIYRMERSFGTSKARTFLLAFPATFNDRDVRAESVRLVIEEFGLRTGAVSFDFDLASLATAVRFDPGL